VKQMKYFITGTSGFIGFHLARRLLAQGHEVTGFDGMTDYYDVRLKQARVGILQQSNHFTNITARLEDQTQLEDAIGKAEPDVIVHLAAQAGVRYSLEAPRSYVESNVTGSFNLLEAARLANPAHVLMASTSSVYGANTEMPFTETQRTDAPLTIYSATKKSMEAMGHSYAHLWKLPVTCFRFFTVYGPWGRPDMALFKFTEAIRQGKPIDVYGQGQMSRDFTYIDDLVEAVCRLSLLPPVEGAPVAGAVDTLSPGGPFRIVNIAGGDSVGLERYIDAVELALGKKAIRNLLPMQMGDVPHTFADARLLEALTGYKPSTPVEVGVKAFVDWHLQHYP
jgi:UDP-glucuronate 4-epimerase